jgi:hypothetical protein
MHRRVLAAPFAETTEIVRGIVEVLLRADMRGWT